MTVVSDGAILELLASGGLGIEPFEPANLTPNGVDLCVQEVLVPDVDGGCTTREGVAVVPPRERFLVATREIVTLGPAVTGQLWIRSSFARKGVLAAFGKVEAGFSGTLTIGALNAAATPLEVRIGDRFCQIAFERLDRPAEKLYRERSGTYQDQRGVTLAR